MDITIEITEITAESTINETVIICDVVIADAGGGMVDVPIETISKNGTPLPITDKNVDITVPTKTSELENDSDFQTVTDNTLQTEAQTIASAINEVNSVAKGANQAIIFENYESVILEAENEGLNVGQNIYIDTIDVPDLWIKSVDISFVPYSYISDEQFITDILAGLQIGYYTFAFLETQKVDLTNYYNKTETNSALASKANLSGGNDFLNTQNFDGRINHKSGEYFYTAASKTTDTVNDTRVINSAGIEIHSICTVPNAAKGGGTWVEIYRIANGYISITSTTTSLFRAAQASGSIIVFAAGGSAGYFGTENNKPFWIIVNNQFVSAFHQGGDVTFLGKQYTASSLTSDTINDRRTSNQSGVKIEEICTGNGATKGGGTWAVNSKILSDGSHQFGNNTNNVTIDANGTVKLNGTATVFDDLSASSLSLQQTGTGISLNIPEACVEFSTQSNLSDYMVQSLQLKHTWKIGSVIHPHIHLVQNSAAIPNMLIQYRWQQNGGAIVTAWTNYKSNVPTFTYTSGSINQILHDGGITPPVGASLSDIIEFRIIRDNANTSGVFAGVDTVAGVVQVKSFDIHFESDQLGGSNLEYAK